MEREDFSRRSLLQGIVAAIAAGAFPSASSQTTQAAAANGLSFLSPLEAADVDAITAQIVPTDDTPGAREAGVVHFIDRALATFLAHLAADYRAQLAEFQAAFRVRYPDAAVVRVARLRAQIAYLTTVDRTPFFEATRLLTLLGMFALPEYGGNRDGVGWKLIGFEDAAYLPAALRLLRSRLSRLRGRSGCRRNERTTYRDSETVDFAIVGSGAAGGVMARELSRAGLSVVVLEQGPRTPAGSARARRAEVLVPRRHHQRRRSRIRRRSGAIRRRRPRREASGLAVVCARRGRRHPALHGELLALSRDRFHRAQRARRDPGTGFADWPITYAELEPYYTKVEWEIGVSGLAGASPFDPPRSKPYPMPPLPVKSSGVLLERGARKLGLHPFPAPMAINSQPYRGRPAVRALRLLPRLRLRGDGEGVDADDDDSGGGGDRPLRGAARQLRRRASRPTPRGRATGVRLLRSATARAVPEGARRGRVRERRGDAAAAAEVGERRGFRRGWRIRAAWSAST